MTDLVHFEKNLGELCELWSNVIQAGNKGIPSFEDIDEAFQKVLRELLKLPDKTKYENAYVLYSRLTKIVNEARQCLGDILKLSE